MEDQEQEEGRTDYLHDIFPTALEDLRDAETYIMNVLKFAQQDYGDKASPRDQILHQTTNYLKDSLGSVVLNVHCVAAHLTEFLSTQMQDLDAIDGKLGTMNKKLRQIRDREAEKYRQQVFRLSSAPATARETKPTRSLRPESELPEYVKPMAPHEFMSIKDRLAEFGSSRSYSAASDASSKLSLCRISSQEIEPQDDQSDVNSRQPPRRYSIGSSGPTPPAPPVEDYPLDPIERTSSPPPPPPPEGI